MKRNKASTLLIISLFCLAFAKSAMAIPIVDLNLVNSPVGIGDTFQVEVWVDGGDIGLDFLSFSFDVNFDNDGFFDYTGYSLTTGFDDDHVFTGNDVSGSIFPGTPDDDVLLATLFFETVAFGTDTLNVQGIYDGMFSGLYYELPDMSLIGYDIDSSLSLSINTMSVPEPSLSVLAVTCLFGLVGVNCRKKTIL